MNNLKYKSECNISSAHLLFSKNFFAPSVHCSYYSCFQLMLHIQRSDFKKSDEEVHTGWENSKKSMHNWLCNLMKKEFALRSNELSKRKFNKNISILRNLRVLADYENEPIEGYKAIYGINLATGILDQLKEKFSI